MSPTHMPHVGVDHLITHGFSCKKSKECLYHGAINVIIHRAMTTACIASKWEPLGVDHTDNKQPDRVMMIQWKNLPIVWNATCLPVLLLPFHQ